VVSVLFSDTWPYLVLIIGIILGFFIVERLIGIFYPQQDSNTP